MEILCDRDEVEDGADGHSVVAGCEEYVGEEGLPDGQGADGDVEG